MTNTIYFILFAISKETKKLSYFHVHHINFIGLLQAVLVAAWSFTPYLSFESIILNSILCYFSEILYGTLKNARAYAMMILALFRFIAVFKINLYKKISNSWYFLFVSALFSWVGSFLLFFIAKYSTGSTSSRICVDGFNADQNMLYAYFSSMSILGFIIPSLIVFIIYFLIQNELKQKSKRIAAPESSTTTANDSKTVRKRNKKEKRLLVQLLLINMLKIMSFVMIFFLTMPRSVFFSDPYSIACFSGTLSCLNSFSLAAIPVIKIYFHPIKFPFLCKK